MAEGGVQEAAIPAHHRTLWVPVMTAGEGCPLPLLFTPGAVQVGADRLKRMHDAAGGDTPVRRVGELGIGNGNGGRAQSGSIHQSHACSVG